MAHVITLQVVQGLIGAVDTPARQAFVVEMVDDRADLPNAIALNSAMFNASRLIGPAIGGALLAAAGEGWCFTVDAISYVAVLGSLLAMRIRGVVREVSTAELEEEVPVGFSQQFREGLAYARSQRPVRALLLLVACMSLLGTPYTVLMPVIATQALRGGAHTLGWLMTAGGAGALVSTTWLAGRPSLRGLGRVMVIATAAHALAMIGLGLAAEPARSLALALAVLPVVGGGMVLATSGANTLLQSILPHELRGRVMALYSTAFFGAQPLGSVIAGALATRIGVPATLVVAGTSALLVVAWFARALPAVREDIRATLAVRR